MTDLAARLETAAKLMRPTEPRIDRPETRAEREHEIQHGLADLMAQAATAARAADACVRVWQEAPSGVSFGRFMERALGDLDIALQALPSPVVVTQDKRHD